MFSKEFWLGDNGALARGIRTFSQTAVAAVTVSTFTPYSVGAWVNVLVISVMAGVVSILMSLDRGTGKVEQVEFPPVPNGHNIPLDFPVKPAEPVYAARPPTTFVGCGDDLR